MAGDEEEHRDFSGRRLLLSALRVAHIVALAGLSAALLGQGGHADRWGMAMAMSGLSIVILDRWSDRLYFHQVKGLVALSKMALVIVLILVEPLRVPLFWLLIVYSVTMAHAPGSIRHRRVF